MSPSNWVSDFVRVRPCETFFKITGSGSTNHKAALHDYKCDKKRGERAAMYAIDHLV